jgi:hypothetical protein
VHTKDLEQYNEDCWVDDFDFCLVSEYLNELS